MRNACAGFMIVMGSRNFLVFYMLNLKWLGYCREVELICHDEVIQLLMPIALTENYHRRKNENKGGNVSTGSI